MTVRIQGGTVMGVDFRGRSFTGLPGRPWALIGLLLAVPSVQGAGLWLYEQGSPDLGSRA